MDEKFIAEGIKKERYLKAKKLGNRFEDEIYELIRDIFRDYVENSELFLGKGSPNPKSTPTIGQATKATLRIDYTLSNVESDGGEDPSNLKLTVGLEWPKDSSEVAKSTESSLYVFYRVKNSSKDTFEEIFSDTEVQKIQFGDNPWNSKDGMFYIPVNSVEDIEVGLKDLRKHFSRHGSQFGRPAQGP